MAKLTQDFNVSPTPNMLGYSQAPNRRDYENKSMETLFSGIGDAISGVAGVADNEIKENIKKDVYGSVDPLRDAQGVGDAAANAAANGDPLNLDKTSTAAGGSGLSSGSGTGLSRANPPPNAGDFEGRLTKLTSAFQAGKISDTYYYSQLEATSRQLRSKYPGYREEVDKMIANVTGVTPANALRKSIQSDLQTAQSTSDAQKSKDETWIKSNLSDLPPDTVSRAANGKPYSMMELYQYAGQRQRERTDLQDTRNQIALARDTNQDPVSLAEQGATKEVDTILTRLTNDSVQSVGGIAALRQKILDIKQKGANATPEDQRQLDLMMTKLEMEFSQAVDKSLTSPLNDKTDQTYRSIIGAEKADKIRSSALARLEELKTAVKDKDMGVLYQHAQITRLKSESRTAQLMEKYPVFANIQSIRQLAGPEILTAMQTRPDNKLLSDTVSAVNDILSNDRRARGTSVGQHLDDIGELEKKTGYRGGGKAYVNTLINDLTNPATPQIDINNAKGMFDTKTNANFLSRLRPEDRTDVFTRLISPQVTSKIEATGDKELWQKYSDWSKNSFNTIFRQAGTDLKNAAASRYFDVEFDTKANQFKLAPSSEAIDQARKEGGNGNLMEWVQKKWGTNLLGQVDKINRGLKVMEPIMKKDGFNVGQELGALIMKARDEDKNNPFWQTLVKTWDRAFTPSTQQQRDAENPLTFGGSNVNFSQPSGARSGGISMEDVASNRSTGSLLDVVSKAEGTDGDRGFNTIFGGKQMPLTTMTISQVQDLQKDMVRKLGFSPVGKFQIKQDTFNGLVKELGLKPDDRFDEATQVRMGEALLEKRGLSKFQKGEMSPEDFHNAIANEWAGLPNTKGVSAYHGDGVNKARIGTSAVQEALISMKDGANVKTGSADTANLNPKTKALLDKLAESGVTEELNVKSGYRDPERNRRAGGARFSKHMDGSAIDLDIGDLDDTQKAALLQAAIDAGARGIGVYPSGRSLHLDTRDTPATWGFSPFGAYKGVHWSAQPKWAHESLKKLFGE